MDSLLGHKIYKSYIGSVQQTPGAKLSIISKYKFCICFENCVADDYISEKIFDCFRGNTVPIYLGAPNIDKYINKKCFIDFRDFDNYDSLLTYLKNMDVSTYNKYIKNAQKFLKSRKFYAEWSVDSFFNTFLSAIEYTNE